MCGDVSYISEGTHFGLDSRSESSMLSIGENAPWVPIEKYSEHLEVYGYRGKQDPPEILEKGTYATAYAILNGGTIILARHNGLGRKYHGNVLLLKPFMMREAGWEVRDVELQHYP